MKIRRSGIDTSPDNTAVLVRTGNGHCREPAPATSGYPVTP